jgi:hypothetical protein
MRGWSKFEGFTMTGNRLLNVSHDTRAPITIPERIAEVVE